MAPSSSRSREALLDVAEASIHAGLDGRGPLRPDHGAFAPHLVRPAAAFVTVLVDGELNGCIGTLEAVDPLVDVVARRAWDAAFADPRLPPLRAADVPHMGIEISVLSPLEPLPAASPDEVLAALRPGVDGLLITAGGRQATFLPVVWEMLPEHVDFLHHLQAKAGIRPGTWPADLKAWRYTVEKVARGLTRTFWSQ